MDHPDAKVYFIHRIMVITVKFTHPQNISWASQHTYTAVSCFFFKHEKKKKHKISLSGVIPILKGPEIPNWFEKNVLHTSLQPISCKWNGKLRWRFELKKQDVSNMYLMFCCRCCCRFSARLRCLHSPLMYQLQPNWAASYTVGHINMQQYVLFLKVHTVCAQSRT